MHRLPSPLGFRQGQGDPAKSHTSRWECRWLCQCPAIYCILINSPTSPGNCLFSSIPGKSISRGSSPFVLETYSGLDLRAAFSQPLRHKGTARRCSALSNPSRPSRGSPGSLSPSHSSLSSSHGTQLSCRSILLGQAASKASGVG